MQRPRLRWLQWQREARDPSIPVLKVLRRVERNRLVNDFSDGHIWTGRIRRCGPVYTIEATAQNAVALAILIHEIIMMNLF